MYKIQITFQKVTKHKIHETYFKYVIQLHVRYLYSITLQHRCFFFHHFWILVPLPETSNRKQAIATATNRKIVIRMSAELPEFAKNS